MEIHLLDMGRNKYGDCILLVEGDHRILVDGGHPGDTASIRRQLTKILKHQAPFEIDMLVVTHCHQDHIGCLPDLIKLGVIIPRLALVADEQLGWGATADNVNAADNTPLSGTQETLLLALQEEDRSDLTDDELEQFFFDAARLEDTYKEMLQTLEDKGCPIVRYGNHSAEERSAVEEAGAPFKFKVLGPSQEHLNICADAIANTLGSARDAVLSGVSADASPSTLFETYRSLTARFERDSAANRFTADRPGIGAAKNNQSLVFSVEAPQAEGSWKALLAGDMQFAKAEVSGLNESMEQLLATVNENGPYDFIKLTHHTSYNGTDEDMLEEWNQQTKLFAHTGGWNDPTHPDGGVLKILEERSDELFFARTDRNGLISVAWQDDVLGMNISKGDFNDFSLNENADETPAGAPPVTQPPATIPGQQPNITTVAQMEPNQAEGFVEIMAKVPHTDTKVTITIDVDPGKKKVHDVKQEDTDLNLPPENRYKGLLFLTSWQSLQNNIKEPSVLAVKSLLQQIEGEILDLPQDVLSSAEAIAAIIRQRLSTGGIKGIVILGGYDIIPAQELDVLPPELREELRAKRRINQDADKFMVWSDDIYGDINGDGFPELPVSRIPDGKDEQLLLKALAAPQFTAKSRFGVRNLARPFAQEVYFNIPGEINQIEISETFSPQDVTPDSALGAVYYMLHGSDRDGTRFWGETADEDEFEAFSIENIPASTPGTVVFTGCCWGALTADPIAAKKTLQTSMRPRKPDQSIALKYLQAGALAFVGTTGSHYSPREAPYNYHGKPMHDHFWRATKEGKSPAQALLEAKQHYQREFPHGETAPFSIAIELKILRQFTCLGLGW